MSSGAKASKRFCKFTLDRASNERPLFDPDIFVRFRNRRNHSLPQPMRECASATVGRVRVGQIKESFARGRARPPTLRANCARSFPTRGKGWTASTQFKNGPIGISGIDESKRFLSVRYPGDEASRLVQHRSSGHERYCRSVPAVHDKYGLRVDDGFRFAARTIYNSGGRQRVKYGGRIFRVQSGEVELMITGNLSTTRHMLYGRPV